MSCLSFFYQQFCQQFWINQDSFSLDRCKFVDSSLMFICSMYCCICFSYCSWSDINILLTNVSIVFFDSLLCFYIQLFSSGLISLSEKYSWKGPHVEVSSFCIGSSSTQTQMKYFNWWSLPKLSTKGRKSCAVSLRLLYLVDFNACVQQLRTNQRKKCLFLDECLKFSTSEFLLY